MGLAAPVRKSEVAKVLTSQHELVSGHAHRNYNLLSSSKLWHHSARDRSTAEMFLSCVSQSQLFPSSLGDFLFVYFVLCPFCFRDSNLSDVNALPFTVHDSRRCQEEHQRSVQGRKAAHDLFERQGLACPQQGPNTSKLRYCSRPTAAIG